MTRLEFNTILIEKTIKARITSVQAILDIQVLKDSNYYIPFMDGTLRASGLQSDFGSGEISWNTPYAARQYYEAPNKSKDENPNARMKWFEEAKATKKKSWEKLSNEQYNK